MATSTLTADRRQFLSAGAAIAAAVSIPVIAKQNPRAAWDAAIAEMVAAEADHTYHAQWVHIPEHVRQRDSTAFRAVMNMPAPDRAALRWKLNFLLEDSDEDQVLGDIARLLGDA